MPIASLPPTGNCAEPQLTGSVPRIVDPSEKVIVPVLTAPDEDVTVAVNTNGSPAVTGFGEDVRVVVVGEVGPEKWLKLNAMPPPGAPPDWVVVP